MASAAAGGGPMNAGEESVHVVSYNMSVFSAQGYAGTLVKSSGGKPAANNSAGFFPSEARLLRRAEQLVDEGITTTNFFINALKHLSDQNGNIIGVQEYADTTLPLFIKYLEKERTKNEDPYKYNYEDFKLTLQPPGRLLTIWDKKFGDVAEKDGLRCVYESDFGRTPKLDGYEATGADNGRPISILKTSKGYFIMNFHGINRGKYKAGSTEESGIDIGPMIQAALNYHIAEAEKLLGTIDTTRLVITCDSNDREGSLGGGLMIKGEKFTDGRTERVVSCCYNFDSCGIAPQPAAGPEPVIGKRLRDKKDTIGKEDEYQYPGDYVLALKLKPLEAVPSPVLEDGISAASDHMLVHAHVTLSMSMSGGRRKNKTRKPKAKKSRKSKKSKKN
jgi:hypothetical protein